MVQEQKENLETKIQKDRVIDINFAQPEEIERRPINNFKVDTVAPVMVTTHQLGHNPHELHVGDEVIDLRQF